MGAWDFNLQIPYQGPAFLAQGLSSLGEGLGNYIAGQREKQKRSRTTPGTEAVKNQTIVKNLFDNKLVSPEQYLEFQSANPRKQKELAGAYAATTAFNLMQQARTPGLTTLQPGGGAPPITVRTGPGSVVQPPFVPQRVTIPGEPGYASGRRRARYVR